MSNTKREATLLSLGRDCHPEARVSWAEGPMQFAGCTGTASELHRSFASLRMTTIS
jgi:hypothetical protein